MKLVLMNIDKFVQANALQEVINPVMLDRGYHPSVDGILSTEIFGSTTESRKRTFAYINLNCHVLQPLIYKTIKRIDRNIDALIMGTAQFRIEKDGTLTRLPDGSEDGNTGIEWLYQNWSKVKFAKNDSKIRNSRVQILESHTRDEIFQSKEIIIPPFFRDINLQGGANSKPAIHKINEPYTRLMRYASILNQGDFTFNLNYNRYQIQQTVVEIYNELKGKLEKKRGILRQSILGKSVDYGARLVISIAKYTAEKPSDSQVDFYHAGIPLPYCVSLFTPFVIGWVQKFFQNQFANMGYKLDAYDAKSKTMTTVRPKDVMLQFNDEKIHEMMKLFVRSAEHRFDTIMIETEDKNHPSVPMYFTGHKLGVGEDVQKPDKDKPLTQRYFTLTDLFFMAAMDICRDKFVYITRYPIADYMSTFPCGIAVLSTTNTTQMQVGDTVYDHYPVVDLNVQKSKIPMLFTEVVNMQNTYLQSIGGDYDGDQITVKGVFSQEATKEAEKQMKSISNLLSINGHNVRSTTIEAIQTLYSTTRWENKNETFE